LFVVAESSQAQPKLISDLANRAHEYDVAVSFVID
jgi:hypothetical protein